MRKKEEMVEFGLWDILLFLAFVTLSNIGVYIISNYNFTLIGFLLSLSIGLIYISIRKSIFRSIK